MNRKDTQDVMKIISGEQLVATPWKNKGGVTREIAVHYADKSLVWRLSMADVEQDGPFSDFSGFTRILTVIDGAGMTLLTPDDALVAKPGRPVRFDGALAIDSRLVDGPLRDLNLIFDPKRVTGTVEPYTGMQEIALQALPSRAHAFFCAKGQASTPAGLLKEGDTFLADNSSAGINLTENSFGLLIMIDKPGN